ncbi:hypothetical protein A2574_00380 [Candidatus Shapirobacteria bacterium RIFOXYD1_FULL_38_32]|uniref:Cohesin domain-containing protein n=3 Tax=Candidatus Shapironibacteriota TaxID=1752721 RepID=A0A0G0JPA8_9BACT|nr:MAG: hypothetical protein US90_C0017G0022 [Candidatus Shapirobacteria bacterium GW2011_GWE2_38_30]OGL56080.1 MAG: hypothetical protein A2410_02425 [Candidatus Shapirobacteria bacterium RIFOXYC1_FULL_38_24]OGL56115.1 MAG: hypothetical protein A2367_00220 [Candidatus Shapirobacteria bacterium RIFOXYB1_FULL_38_38]OGL56245.1 MAG: hypothetical protein A2195_00830 [Candidatus Shapirobacteria bacterium RIFOXYA1_FULL_39_17]OGL58042.1 MAG: hypothetical protein A2574_00380 [Candidatus Shapirobacteria 
MNNKYLKILIPVVAIIVILESVILISRASKPQTANLDGQNMEQAGDAVVDQEPVLEFMFETKSNTMQLNRASLVKVNMVPVADYNLDAVELYVKYDPEVMTISGLNYDKSLPKPTFSKVSVEKGMVVANFLISEEAGFGVRSGEIQGLISFMVTPKVPGNYTLEVNKVTLGEESATLVVDNGTKNALPFTSNKLDINVLE